MSVVARTLFAPWVLPAARLVLLAAPITLINREEDTLHQLMLIGVWMVLSARWVFGKADSSKANFDFLAEMLILVIAACKTLVLSKMSAAEWLLPLLLVLAVATFVYLLYPVGWIEESDTKAEPPKPKPLWATIAFSLLLGGQGLVLAFLDSSSSMASVRSALLLVEAACSVTLASRPSAVWIQTWMLLQLCSLPEFYARSFLLFAVSLYVVLAVLLLLVALDGSKQGGLPVLTQLWHTLHYSMRLLGKLLTSRVLYQSVLLLSFFIIATSLNRAWHTSHTTTTPELKDICEDVLDVIDTYVQPVWEFTGEPAIQEILVPAASEIALARLSMYRILEPFIPFFLMGRDGVSFTFTPAESIAPLLAFVIGPCLSALAVVCSLFPRGDAPARSAVFWLAASFLNIPFLVFTQIATGIRVQLVRIIFVDSEYERQHTPTGELAMVASLGVLVSSFMLFLAANHSSQEEDEELVPVVVASPPPRTSGRYRHLEPGKTWGRWFLDGLTAPYVLLLGAAIFVLIVSISSQQNPVKSFELVKVRKLPPDYDWLYLTQLDQLSPAINSLTKLLVFAIGPQARIIPLVMIGNRAVESLIACVPCLCLDDIGDAIGDLFSRRRLLQSPNPESKWHFDIDNLCEARDSDSCSGPSVCLSDVLAGGFKVSEFAVELFGKVLEWATEQLAKVLSEIIPSFDEIEEAFSGIQDLLSFRDFDFTSFANLEMPSIGSLVLPDVRLPKIVIPDTAGIVTVSCIALATLVALFTLGILGALTEIFVRGVIVSIILTFWTWLGFVFVFAFELRDEVRIFTDRWADIQLDETACAWYLLAVVLLAMASLTFLADFALPKANTRTQTHHVQSPSSPTNAVSGRDVRSPVQPSKVRARI